MSRDEKDNSLSDTDQAESVEQVIREILQYLVEHPDAKDTTEGILKWWLPVGCGKGRERVQKALDFLTSNGWVTKRETTPPKGLYGINKERLSEIRDFLRARQAEKT